MQSIVFKECKFAMAGCYSQLPRLNLGRVEVPAEDVGTFGILRNHELYGETI